MTEAMRKAIITLSAVAIIAGGIYTVLHATESSAPGKSLFVRTSDNTENEISAEPSSMDGFISQADFTRAAENTVNGVVSVKSFATPRSRQQAPEYGDLFDFFFGTPRQAPRRQQEQSPRQQQQTGLGSGVIISADGYIVTNNHVIDGAERLEVTLNDNRNFPATVIGSDADTDLALIKIEAPDLHVIPMGDSEKLKVGEWVLAVGNPFGFTSTVTSGIVSAKARNISSSTGMPASGGIESYIQTDAAVNSGNSGGALVNLKGELVGINAAIYSKTGTYAGCSFAIPTSIVQKVVSDLHAFGTVQRAYLGITFRELTPELIAQEKIEGPVAGIHVEEVLDRSAALEAGLKKGDVITSVGGKTTTNTAQLQEAITAFSPGDKVKIEYWRDGRRHTTDATLRNNTGGTTVIRPDNEESLGATFAPVNTELARKLGISHGVTVESIEPEGRFADQGMRAGFIILEINGTRISSADEIVKLYKALAKSSSGLSKVMFISGIYPDGRTAFYAVPLTD